MENLYKNFLESINESKKIFDELIKDKENIKLKIQTIFTKIRNILNDREDELLLEIDNKYNDLFFNEDIIKEGEKLPNKIKESLDNGKILENEWNNKNLKFSVFNCINIENNIKQINTVNDNLKKCKINSTKIIKIYPEENDKNMNEFLKNIKKFGKISFNNFKFKKCPININESRKFEISGEEENIITKIGQNGWAGTICENELDKKIEEHIWKFKILKTNSDFGNIFIGVANSDFDINSSSYEQDKNKGWYFYPYTEKLYSGFPRNYQRKNINNLKSKNNEVTVIMNMKKGTLKFIIDKEDKGDSYTNIPLDKPLFPSVLLYHLNDSVEIIN